MLANSFNFVVPQGWHELTDKQLRYVYRLIASDFEAESIQLLCLLRWSKAKVVDRHESGAFLLRHRRDLFEATPLAIAELLPHMAWLGELPPLPVRPSILQGKEALDTDFAGVPFEIFLAVENLYQGFMTTQRDELLDTLATLLYPGLKGELAPWERIAVFYWAASLKDFFARRFSEFFQPVADSSSNLLGDASPDVEAAMNAQIRALTKGDVTKEREILALDTWRALTELNAQAREYRELNAKLNSNK